MTAKKYPNLTKEEALSLAWKQRKDYKGYDKSKGSMYNSWRAKIYTVKGRSIGYPDKWKTFEGFKEDVEEGWFKGAILIRKDLSKPYSKENCYWGIKGGELYNRSIKLTYNNETRSLAEWSAILNVNLAGIKIRYHRHKDTYTVEEILFGKKRTRKRTFLNKEDLEYQQRRNKINKMISAYKCKDKKRNFICDLDFDFVDKLTNKPCIYCGDTHNIGLDRIDNSKGHTKDNVVPCCVECNTVRNDLFTVEEMIKLGKTIRQIKDDRRAKSSNTET